MRVLTVIILILGLAGCEAPTPIDPATRQQALDLEIDSFLDEANANKGQRVGKFLVLSGARREGNLLILRVNYDPGLVFGALDRQEIAERLSSLETFACEGDTFSRLIDLGGRLRVDVDPLDGQAPISVVSSEC